MVADLLFTPATELVLAHAGGATCRRLELMRAVWNVLTSCSPSSIRS